MKKFEETLNYLSHKEWKLKENWKKEVDFLKNKIGKVEQEENKSIKRYIKIFKEPLTFEHDLTTYKTGRIYAKYVLLPNKPICGILLKELIVPKKGYSFVSFDFESSQIRHIAVELNIQRLKTFFEEDKDVYEEYAKEIGISERKIAKTILLLLNFAGTKRTIIKKFGDDISEKKIDKAIEIYEKWFKKKAIYNQEKIKFNHRIQKREVEFFKKKLNKLYEKQNDFFNLHAFIHDEIICEIRDDHFEYIEKIKKYVEKNKEVKMKTKIKISKNFQFKR